MDPKISKKTADTLGKIIKKPPLTEKLLGKPPFRFLHDITTSVIKTTGFMQGLFSEDEMNSENVKEKDAKIAFLQKAIDMVAAVTGKNISAKPAKIVAGHEPERTNEFLQALAEAINKNVNNNEYVRKVLKIENKEDKKDKPKEKSERRKEGEEKDKNEINDRDKSREREKDKVPDKEREQHKDRDKDSSKSRDKSKDGREKEERPKERIKEHRDRGDRHRDKEEVSKVKEERSKDKVERSRDKEDRTKNREEKSREKEEKHKDKEDRHKEASKKDGGVKPKSNPEGRAANPYCGISAAQDASKTTFKNKETFGMDAEASLDKAPHNFDKISARSLCKNFGENLSSGDHEFKDLETDNEEPKDKQKPASLQRPTSAKGSRRRREGKGDNDGEGSEEEEDEEFQKPAGSREGTVGNGDLPPQVVAARQMARPSSARPAPPRPKQDIIESEPAMRLGSGQPANVIVDDDDDDDEHFIVEEAAAPIAEQDFTTTSHTEDDGEHGALVKKMLESKKDLEGGNKTLGAGKKTEIERPSVSDAQRRKQREQVQKEVDKLRGSIQSLTRSANPLGKVMDYVQEDLDSMQQELDKWRAENAQHALELKRETNVTDRAVEPLKQQLVELERAIKDQLDQIAATKANIIKNDQKIQKMLHGIASS